MIGPWHSGKDSPDGWLYEAAVLLCPLPMRLLIRIGFLAIQAEI